MSVITDAELVEEYDERFRHDPWAWVSAERNYFMLETMKSFGRDLSSNSRHFVSRPYPETVLDVGCGNGHTLQMVNGQYPATTLYGMDISEEALALAKVRVPDLVAVESFVDQTSLGIRFDWVLCMGTAEHFKRIHKSLRRLKTLTGGFCYLEVPNCLSYSPGMSGFRRLSCGSRQYEWHLERETWEKHLEVAGFEIVEALSGKNPVWEFVWVLK